MGLRLFAKLWRRRRRSARRSGSAILSAAVVVFLGTGLMAVSSPAAAMINVGGGYYCSVTTYSVDGEIQGWFYDNCFYGGGGGNPGPDPGGYHPAPGGGGGPDGNPGNCPNLVAPDDSSHLNLLPPTDPGDGGGSGGGGGSGDSGSECDDGGNSRPPAPIDDLDEEDNCNVNQYAYNDKKPIHPIRKKSAWRYYKRYSDPKEYKQSSVQLELDPYVWADVNGDTLTEGGTSYLYNSAFRPYNGNIEGRIGTERMDTGSMTTEEHILFVAAHEAAHQNGVTSEMAANFYGAYAVQNYRAGGDGEECN